MADLYLACVVGARPNFMKMAPLLRALEAYPQVRAVLVHTGQHYDENLSDVFFEELGMKRPDLSLGVGSGKHAAQTARVLERFEAALQQGPAGGTRYDRVVVVGDVNSTMAATLAAVKLGVPVAHVEAGLRSFDRSMPEEVNRIVTDALCDMLFVSEPAGMENLRREGHADDQLHLVGNVMIDTLRWLLPKAERSDTLGRPCTARRTSTRRTRSAGCWTSWWKHRTTCRWCSPSIPGRNNGSSSPASSTASPPLAESCSCPRSVTSISSP